MPLKKLALLTVLTENTQMTKKSLLIVGASISFLFPFEGVKASENTAGAAMSAVPEEFSDTIIKISGSGCSPDPSAWLVLAYQDEIGDGPREFKIVDGEVDGDHASFKVGQLVSHSTAIDRSRVRVDSPEIFAIASSTLQNAGKNLASANLSLTQDGDGAAPTWTAVCLDESGAVVGTLRISADSGAIFSKDIRAGTP